ncbi:MAG: TlpA disulfide reductase family protein [Bacteroidota bacterium]
MNYVITALFALSLLSCQSKTEQQSNNQQASSQYRENVSLLLTNKQPNGEQAPDFTWYNQDGKQVSFVEYSKGKAVLVNFWATWCGPCVRETPDLVELSKEYASQGIAFIGISADRGDDAMDLVSEFVKKYQVTYPIVIDNGNLEEAFGGLRGYPTTFYIDRSGKIVKKMIGMQSKEKFAQELKSIL